MKGVEFGKQTKKKERRLHDTCLLCDTFYIIAYGGVWKVGRGEKQKRNIDDVEGDKQCCCKYPI